MAGLAKGIVVKEIRITHTLLALIASLFGPRKGSLPNERVIVIAQCPRIVARRVELRIQTRQEYEYAWLTRHPTTLGRLQSRTLRGGLRTLLYRGAQTDDYIPRRTGRHEHFLH